MPLGAITSGDRLQKLALKLLSSNVGFHRVNLAMMLSGAFWAIYSVKDHLDNAKLKKYILLLCFIMFYALALTGGRTGYATWGAIGLIFSIMLWKRLLVYGPIFILIILALVPAARERFEMGFDEESADTKTEAMYENQVVSEDSDVDLYTVTSGRTIAWPYVIEKIKERPLLGYGKEAMLSAGVAHFLFEEYGERFPHPHNLYLQWIFDNGLLFFIPVLALFYYLIKYSLSLLRDKSAREYQLIGAISLSLILALLIAGIGSQTFYPREGSVPMWAAIFIMLRVYVQRSKLNKLKMNQDQDTKEHLDLWNLPK
jgi:O-antigen ligase